VIKTNNLKNLSFVSTFSFISISLFIISISPVQASNTYTIEDVAKHSSIDDCWMTYDKKVYNFTSYLNTHDILYMNISDWCGKDMTEDFMTKAGLGRNHKLQSYNMLDDYYIAELTNQTLLVEIDSTEKNENQIEPTYHFTSYYNSIIPFLGSIILYTLTWYLTKAKNSKNKKLLPKPKFHFIWNTIMILTAIPSVLFGILMAMNLQYELTTEIMKFIRSLYWWHVHGSMIFGTVALMHLLTRATQYLFQLKRLLK